MFVLSVWSGTDLTAQPLQITSRDLLAATAAELTELLELSRPDPVSPAEKAGVLHTLPEKGEVTRLDATSRLKLIAVVRVLQAAKRESTYVVKIIDLPQAVVGLHARTVVLISRMALTLLSSDELRALVAHEIGHEYVWADYERSKELADDTHLQDLELICDILAVVTLRTVAQDGSALITGIEKLVRFNRTRFGTADHESRYPSLARRRAVIRAVEAEFESRPRDPLKDDRLHERFNQPLVGTQAPARHR